jgi:excisionase family DNA binding protein
MTREQVITLNDSEMLTTEQAALRMNMSARHVRRLVTERRIPFHKIGRSVRLASADVAQYLASTRIEPMTQSDVWRGLRGVV